MICLSLILAIAAETVTLLHPGHGPRTVLRYAPSPGHLRMEAQIHLTRAHRIDREDGEHVGTLAESPNLRLQLRLSTQPESTTVHIEQAVLSVDGRSSPVAALQDKVAFLTTVDGAPRVSPRGLPYELQPLIHALFTVYPPFPDEPVGVGALYLYERSTPFRAPTGPAVRHRQLARVVAIDGDRVELAISTTVLDAGPPAPLPEGAYLERRFFTGGGQGRVTVGLRDLSVEGSTDLRAHTLHFARNPDGDTGFVELQVGAERSYRVLPP